MTSTLGWPIPPRPASFTPTGAPAGIEVKLVTDHGLARPLMKKRPRVLLIHTNGANNEGTVESSWRHALLGGDNTCPHYQIDRTHPGRVPGRKMLGTDRKAIGNATVKEHQGSHGNISEFSIVIETADLGWPMPPPYASDRPGGACGFDEWQGEWIARCVAYESIVWDFDVRLLDEWYGEGVGGHTDPFGYPYTTIHVGKPCPGDQKKREIREWIIPRAAEIRAAWLTADRPVVVPPPTPVTPPPAPIPMPPPLPPQGDADMSQVTELVEVKGAIFAVVDHGVSKFWIARGEPQPPNGDKGSVAHVAWRWRANGTHDGTRPVIRTITNESEMHGLGPVTNCDVPSAEHAGQTLIQLGWDQYGWRD